MYKLVGINSEISWNSLNELHRDFVKFVCNDCLESSSTLLQLLESGCGSHYNIELDGEIMSYVELRNTYEQECEEMYDY